MWACLSFGLFAVGSVTGQVLARSPVRPTADAVLERMLERNGERLVALQHYSTERTYELHYTGVGGAHTAEIRVLAEYTGPDQKQFTVVSESGSKLLCDKVLRRLLESEREAGGSASRMQSTLSPENYDAEIVGEEVVESLDTGGPTLAWVLHVVPKVASKFTYKGTVWVSEDDLAVIRIAGEPAKNPSLWIDRAHFDSRYVRRGQIWLPGRNVSSSHVRLGGEATLTIDYGSYPEVSVKPQVQTAVAHEAVVRAR
jgi:hypothetical protein